MARTAVRFKSDPDVEPEVPPKDGGGAGGADTNRRKYSISLSKRSAEAFAWLKETTDSDTDSEVVRNALRLHSVLLHHHVAGDEFFVRSQKGGELVKINLFVSTTSEGD
jgi:hypothetical protein